MRIVLATRATQPLGALTIRIPVPKVQDLVQARQSATKPRRR